MKLLVSACLMGRNCKYSGGNNYSQKLADYIESLRHNGPVEVYEVCPEVMGGLSTPRIPCEIVDGVVINREGTSCDKEYHLGAELALQVATQEQIDLAILQSRSPSCGVKQVYDGTFSKTLRDGQGVFAGMLLRNGFQAVDVADLSLPDQSDKNK